MKNGRTIALLLSLSAVFAFALAVVSWMKCPSSSIRRTTLSGMDPASISSVVIDRTTRDGRPLRIELVRIGGKWRLSSPMDAEADAETVNGIMDAVVFAEPQDSLSCRDMATLGRTMRDFGLASPRVSVTLAGDGVCETYAFGRETAAGGEVYVRQEGFDFVFTVHSRALEALVRPAGEFRRRNLFSFIPGDVVDIGMKKAGEPLSKITRSGGGWRLCEPLYAPADRKVADGLLNAICSARIVSYARRGEAMRVGLGVDDGGYVLTVRSSLGGIEKVVFGSAAGTNEVWALSPEGAVVKVSSALLETCRDCQQTLEDTRVFPVDASSVTSISVSEGFPAYMLSRRDASDAWRLVSPVDAPADAANAERMLAKVLAIRGIDVISVGTNSLSVTVGTATTNFPVCVLSADFLPDGMRLADLRDRLLIRCPAEKVKRVRVGTAAGVEWEMRGGVALRNGEESHGLFELLSNGIVAEGVETVMLRKEDFSRCGFDRPSYTIAFELDDAESALRTLLLGDAAPGGGRFATIGGSDAAFILSAATVSTLTRPDEETLKEKK